MRTTLRELASAQFALLAAPCGHLECEADDVPSPLLLRAESGNAARAGPGHERMRTPVGAGAYQPPSAFSLISPGNHAILPGAEDKSPRFR